VRFILVTKERIALLKSLDKIFTFGQDGDFMCFNTSTGNATIELIPKEVKKAMKQKTVSARFDRLFALTKVLKDNDSWIQDNEEDGKDGDLVPAVKTLSAAWKILWKESDASLGIDAEFTRPGVECLLKQFQDFAGSTPCGEDTEFNWQ